MKTTTTTENAKITEPTAAEIAAYEAMIARIKEIKEGKAIDYRAALR